MRHYSKDYFPPADSYVSIIFVYIYVNVITVIELPIITYF